MMDELHRRSIRIEGYDYSHAGGYFITIIASERKCIFGKILGEKMKLSGLGKIIQHEWFRTAQLRAYIELYADEFVIMPNHIHGIIWIKDYMGERRNEMVGARRRRAPTGENFGMPVSGSVPTIVRAFKASVTYHAHRTGFEKDVWQRNYYEHIIRNELDYELITGYIMANPENWSQDNENPAIYIATREPIG